MGYKVLNERWKRWHTCSLCEQQYHGVVRCALGWACWKTYVGRPERDWARGAAMTWLGNGLTGAGYNEDAVSVQEAELSMRRRLGDSEANILSTLGNLAASYDQLGRSEEAANAFRDVYSGFLKLKGGEHERTLIAASNYAASLRDLQRFEEIKSLMRRQIPVARRVLGESDVTTLRIMWNYADALYKDPDATLHDLNEAVTTLEDAGRIARRVLGGAHPVTVGVGRELLRARAIIRTRETPSPGSA